MRIREVEIEVIPVDEEIKELANKIEKISEGKKISKEEKIIFNSIEDLRKFLTPERIRLIHIIKIKKPHSIYQLAKLLGRDRKSVTVDLDILKTIGLVDMKKKSSKNRTIMTPEINYNKINIAIAV